MTEVGMPERTQSLRQEQRDLAVKLRDRNQSWAEIAVAFRERFGVNARVAPRLAHGWSQRQAADRWNARWPNDPKTFKNFSYWENWPSKTGYAPSLEVLARLAELYECHVSDLVADYADFSHRDCTHVTKQRLTELTKLADTLTDADPAQQTVDTTEITRRLDELDVQDVAKLGAAWVQQSDGAVDRRTLLLKLSAGLTLAASASVFTEITAAPANAAIPDRGDANLDGIWHSRYEYFSDGRKQQLDSQHFLVMRTEQGKLVGRSLPNTLESEVALELAVNGLVATGTWSERTSPNGYYKGAIYHGAIHLIVDPLLRTMSGSWLGFDKQFRVNSGSWELRRVDRSTTRRAAREYYMKA